MRYIDADEREGRESSGAARGAIGPGQAGGQQGRQSGRPPPQRNGDQPAAGQPQPLQRSPQQGVNKRHDRALRTREVDKRQLSLRHQAGRIEVPSFVLVKRTEPEIEHREQEGEKDGKEKEVAGGPAAYRGIC